jgi:hypothetical protein
VNQLRSLTVIALSLLCLAAALVAGDALGASAKSQLVGSWMLVSAINTDPSGNKVELFGPNPKGSFMLDRHGRFSILIVRPDLPKFASNNRMAGTPEEDKAVVGGSIAYFGTYTVSEAEKTIDLHVEGSTYPNWTGSDQKRPFTLTGDQLRYTNKAPSVGSGSAEVVWKRVK